MVIPYAFEGRNNIARTRQCRSSRSIHVHVLCPIVRSKLSVELKEAVEPIVTSSNLAVDSEESRKGQKLVSRVEDRTSARTNEMHPVCCCPTRPLFVNLLAALGNFVE
jgi:hypothetical protein